MNIERVIPEDWRRPLAVVSGTLALGGGAGAALLMSGETPAQAQAPVGTIVDNVPTATTETAASQPVPSTTEVPTTTAPATTTEQSPVTQTTEGADSIGEIDTHDPNIGHVSPPVLKKGCKEDKAASRLKARVIDEYRPKRRPGEISYVHAVFISQANKSGTVKVTLKAPYFHVNKSKIAKLIACNTIPAVVGFDPMSSKPNSKSVKGQKQTLTVTKGKQVIYKRQYAISKP